MLMSGALTVLLLLRDTVTLQSAKLVLHLLVQAQAMPIVVVVEPH